MTRACALACSANSLRRTSPATHHWKTLPSAPHVSSVVSSGDHQMLRTFAACALHIGLHILQAGLAALPACWLRKHTFDVCTSVQVPHAGSTRELPALYALPWRCRRQSCNDHLMMPSGSQV